MSITISAICSSRSIAPTRRSHRLNEALRQKPNYVEAQLNLGKAHSGLGQHEAAEKAYRRALWLNPGNPMALQLLARR